MQKSIGERAKAAPPPAPAAAQPSQPSGAPLGLLWNKPLWLAAGTLALLFALNAVANWWTFGRFQVSTDDAYVAARAATLAPKIQGYVTDVAITDNARVKAGDLIVRIDPGDYLLAVRAANNACDTQRAAIARIGQQITAQQSTVDQAKAQLQAAQAGAIKAVQDLKRQQELATRKINSAQALDQAQAAHDQAKATVTAATASLQAAIATVGVLEAQRLEAHSQLRQAETALAKSERDLTFTEMRAPFDGVIGNRAVQVGDYVQPAQRIASLVPLQAIYIDANFKETQLSRLQPGQRVAITVDALPNTTIEGTVVSVAPASGSVFSLLPPDNATGNFTKVVQRVPVRIALPESALQLGVLRPGMSVVVRVDTREGEGKSTPPPPAHSPAGAR
jgi:membrane fusion protein, multidrug efflux system